MNVYLDYGNDISDKCYNFFLPSQLSKQGIQITSLIYPNLKNPLPDHHFSPSDSEKLFFNITTRPETSWFVLRIQPKIVKFISNLKLTTLYLDPVLLLNFVNHTDYLKEVINNLPLLENLYLVTVENATSENKVLISFDLLTTLTNTSTKLKNLSLSHLDLCTDNISVILEEFLHSSMHPDVVSISWANKSEFLNPKLCLRDAEINIFNSILNGTSKNPEIIENFLQLSGNHVGPAKRFGPWNMFLHKYDNFSFSSIIQ